MFSIAQELDKRFYELSSDDYRGRISDRVDLPADAVGRVVLGEADQCVQVLLSVLRLAEKQFTISFHTANALPGLWVARHDPQDIKFTHFAVSDRFGAARLNWLEKRTSMVMGNGSLLTLQGGERDAAAEFLVAAVNRSL